MSATTVIVDGETFEMIDDLGRKRKAVRTKFDENDFNFTSQAYQSAAGTFAAVIHYAAL